MELFGATNIRRKIILEGGLVAVDDSSGSGAAVGANDAPLTVFETTSHYDYDHTVCTNFSPHFATSSECSACKCQECKAKLDGVINDINALIVSVKEMASKRGSGHLTDMPRPTTGGVQPVTPTGRASIPCHRSLSSENHGLVGIIKKLTRDLDNNSTVQVDVTVEDTTEEYNITVDNPSNVSKEEEKIEPVSSGEQKNYPFKGFNVSDEAPKKLTQLINDYTEWIADGLLKHHADRDCGLFIAEYLSDGLQVPNDGLDVGLLRKRYASLLRKYREAKAQKPYASDIKDPRRPK
ncbi:hypothetical protein CQW23_06969 [Capsicum baccatum]|uniref:Ubiquitin-like protease family profile domain-containing protein n=1 Tax=Capsicum baccatum TaxID=33114 RepID=A0A2G2X4W1_CAPBA|nr:hypothetical protein CQW23_06969 [Capsicum baccatum]